MEVTGVQAAGVLPSAEGSNKVCRPSSRTRKNVSLPPRDVHCVGREQSREGIRNVELSANCKLIETNWPVKKTVHSLRPASSDPGCTSRANLAAPPEEPARFP